MDERILYGSIVVLILLNVYLISSKNTVTKNFDKWKIDNPINKLVSGTSYKSILNAKFNDPVLKAHVDGLQVSLFKTISTNKKLLCENKEMIKLGISKQINSYYYSSEPMDGDNNNDEIDYNRICSASVDELYDEMTKDLSRDLEYIDTEIYGSGSLSDIKNSAELRDIFMYGSKLVILVARKFCKNGTLEKDLIMKYVNTLIDEFCSNDEIEKILKINYQYIMNYLSIL